MAVDGHHWPSAGVRRGMTDGVASSVREKREGGFAGPARPGWAEQKGREGGRAGARVGRERACVHLGRARGG
jgi:hypothetical protein